MSREESNNPEITGNIQGHSSDAVIGSLDAAESVATANKEIESLLGINLPDKRLSSKHEEILLKRIREAPKDARDEEAEVEYLGYRARRVYSTARSIPESNGLTFEDYFQIGCEVVVTEARGVNITELNYDTSIYLQNKIKYAINQAGKDMYFGSSASHKKNTEEEHKTELYPSQIGKPELGRQVDTYSVAERRVMRGAIDKALDGLPERERRIMELRYGLGEENGQVTGLEETGREFGVTRERVRQIQNYVLKRLNGSIELDFTEEGTDQQVEEATPFVIARNAHESRFAKRLGYKVADRNMPSNIEMLRNGRVPSPNSKKYKVSKILARMIEKNKLWHFLSISDIRGTHAEAGLVKVIRGQIRRRERTLKDIWSRDDGESEAY